MGLTNPDGSQALSIAEKQSASDIIDRDKKNAGMSGYEKSLIQIVHSEIEKRSESEKGREQKRIEAVNNPSAIVHELKRHNFQFKPGEFESVTGQK